MWVVLGLRGAETATERPADGDARRPSCLTYSRFLVGILSLRCPPTPDCMSGRTTETELARIGLSESDLDRIAKFAGTPRYAREPEMLLPDDHETPASER